MQPNKIFTIGYEGSTIDEFIKRLNGQGIDTLIDIREIASSRNRNFSKTKFHEHLQAAGINYIHIRKLGSPKKMRDKLHKDNNYDSFFDEYLQYLNTIEDDLNKLYEDVITKNISCLMCMERDHFKCHRQVVAKKIQEIDGNGLIIKNI
ncbi:MAG: DUF488 domain-containing protein [Nitrospirae bacterium]|nr:DUF488 domain-containing protein [Nitrospirota bacterium]